MAVFDILSNSGILPYYLLGIRASFIRKYGKVRQKVLSDVRNTIYDDMPCNYSKWWKSSVCVNHL